MGHDRAACEGRCSVNRAFTILQLGDADDAAKQAVLKYIWIKLGYGADGPIINPAGANLDQLIDFYDYQLNKQFADYGGSQ